MKRSKKQRKPAAPARDESLCSTLAHVIAASCDRLEALCSSGGIPGQEEVHEVRNELRRVAALVRFFAADSRRGNGTVRLLRHPQNLSRSLGAARDATVWNKLLRSKAISRAMADESGWMEFIAKERDREEAAYAALMGFGSRPPARNALAALRRFLRDGLPGMKSNGDAAEMVASHLKPRAKRLIAKDLAALVSDPHELHGVRRKMRRLRYLADTFAPELPHKVRRLAKKLHRTEARLGELHDLDVALARLKNDRRKPAAKLAHTLARRRRKLAGKC